jgi:hypothetical protein
MLKFKDFFVEQDETLDIETPHLEAIMNNINADLDALGDRVFQNSVVFINTVRGTVERYGILIPPSYGTAAMSMSAELVYKLGESGKFLYVVHDTNEDGFVEGYAQVVNNEELKELSSLDSEDWMKDTEESEIQQKVPYRHRDDDSGNDDEY